MFIKRLIIPLLLIVLLASMVAFGANIPLGPYFDDTYFDLSDSALILKVIPHEKGGLEADVSDYDGLLKISGGSTSAVTDNSANWNTAFGWGDHSTEGYLKVITGESIGDLNDVDLTDLADNKILKYNSASSKWEIGTDEGGAGATEFTGLIDTPANYTDSSLKYVRVNEGETALEFVELGGGGDMLKATYDTDTDGIVDKAETVDDGAGNSSTAADVKDAVTKKHAAGADTTLGTLTADINMGTHKLTGLSVPSATGQSVRTTATITEANLEDAISKKHTQNTDTAAGGEWDFGAHSAGFTIQTDTGTGEKTIDWKLGNKMKFTFGAGNVTFTFTAPTNPCTLMLTLIQDVTGSRTVTWPATVKWPGGTAPTLTTTANARDKVALDWDGSQYDGVCSKDFK